MMKRRWPEVLVVAALAGGLALAMTAPPDRLQGNLQRIMYVHVPSAWLAYLAFAVTVVGSVGWLLRRRARWDHLAASSAELGVVFTGLALLTGMLWAKPVWGVFWTWDPRLVTTALLFFVYLGYLALRRSTAEPEVRAGRSAILGIVAFTQVPVVHFSVIWWRTLHQPPSVLRPDGPSLDTAMLTTLLANVAVFTVVYLVALGRRYRLAAALADQEVAPEEPAGAAVTAPHLREVSKGV